MESFSQSLNSASALMSRAQHAPNPEQEVRLSLQAVEELEAVCGPFHVELYKARGQLMTAYLLDGAWNSNV